MKKGIIYIALTFFLAGLTLSCSSRKGQCGAYAKEDSSINKTESSI